MESTQQFQDLVRQRIIAHEFTPICIEVAARKANDRAYENQERVKAKHRRWRKTERGLECERERGKRYREKNKDNEEYKQRKRANSQKCYRKKRTNALWMLFTYDGQREN